jgi:hypothetical protein
MAVATAVRSTVVKLVVAVAVAGIATVLDAKPTYDCITIPSALKYWMVFFRKQNGLISIWLMVGATVMCGLSSS